eukprot:14586407-Alexandrium_andersonii.AAC.1
MVLALTLRLALVVGTLLRLSGRLVPALVLLVALLAAPLAVALELALGVLALLTILALAAMVALALGRVRLAHRDVAARVEGHSVRVEDGAARRPVLQEGREAGI